MRTNIHANETDAHAAEIDDMIIVSREPVHPGEFLREEYMPELGLSVAGLAQRLGVTRQTVNDIVRERRGLSPDMCLRLARLFGTSPQFWMNMQAKVDLWNSLALHRDDIDAIEPFETPAVAIG